MTSLSSTILALDEYAPLFAPPLVIAGIAALVVVVVEVGVAEVLKRRGEAAGDEYVVEGLQLAGELEAVAVLGGSLVPEVVEAGRAVFHRP